MPPHGPERIIAQYQGPRHRRSARSVKHFVVYSKREHTDYEHETFGFSVAEGMLLHAMDDGTCEVAVEHCPDVDQVEDKPSEQEIPDRSFHGHRE